MMKITLTEQQVDMIQNHINDQNYGKYRTNVNPNVYFSESTYKGNEIMDIIAPEMTLRFDIEIEARSWGIKTANVYNVNGNDSIEFEVSFLVNNKEKIDNVTIPFNWENVIISKSGESGPITIHKDIEIRLENDTNGNLIIKYIEVYVNSF